VGKKPSIDLLPAEMRNGFTVWVTLYSNGLYHLSDHDPSVGDRASSAATLLVDVTPTHVQALPAEPD